ncbi:MAG TPA: von Willebrand factor type A domain-containing protein [Micromonosporaceae bacterium]|nr:von Willebrand factor type A domain-containing protein [Micromonosporaceae bacterium]
MATLRRVAVAALAVALAATVAGCTADADRSDGGLSAAPDGGVPWRTETDERGEPGEPGEPDPEDGLTDPREKPRSTFAMDVDTASYGYARRMLTEGRRPDAADIRPEEFVNAFDQRYQQPPDDGFTVSLDGARPPVGDGSGGAGGGAGGDGLRVLRVGLQTRADDAERRPDVALTIVLDVSGSMAERGRLDLVQDALHTLVDQLRPTDAVALVAFNDEARVVREMTRVADADALHRAISGLAAGGSTNLEDGLVTGYEVARDGFRRGGTNRVVILSDGLANVGSTDAEPILRRVADEAGKQVALLGVGVGSEYGDELMERLADRGDGFVVYVSERSQARELFVRRLPATLTVRALDAKVQVTFNEAAVRAYRLIGYENRALAEEDFRDDRVDGGEVGPGHSVTALYEVRLSEDAARADRVAEVAVRWLDPDDRRPAEASGSIGVADLDGDFDDARPRLWVCYAAAYLAESLRGKPVSLRVVEAIAREAHHRTDDPAVGELADLVERARELD